MGGRIAESGGAGGLDSKVPSGAVVFVGGAVGAVWFPKDIFPFLSRKSHTRAKKGVEARWGGDKASLLCPPFEYIMGVGGGSGPRNLICGACALFLSARTGPQAQKAGVSLP